MSIPRPNGRGNTDRISIPCGKCPSCLQNKRASWGFRLSQELKNSETASFITLTYNDESNVGSLSKNDVTLFLKRLREASLKVIEKDHSIYDPGLKRKERVKLRYFLTGEYGSNTFRPHYHMILFNHPVLTEMELYELINKCWRNGSSHIGSVTEASIAYVAKYLLKGSVTPEGCEEPFSIMSRRPGIGFEYINRMQDWHQADQRFFVQKPDGVKQGIPRYYRDKIFSKTDKEEQSIKIQSEIDRIENEKLFNTFAKGENPFVNELLQKEDKTRKLKNVIKKGKL